ncbi:MAG: quinolinate synthase NadA, partial [Thermodesulfobacteriota bacterium]|nr:quinolinate synthase NadA [Thermodesulfobacteriota bacterium]
MENDEIRERIKALKKKHDAIILAHNYQLGEIQDVADITGDSLELSQKAEKTDAKTIVFCGVHFMAETAAILCPDKTVILPDINAGCPMADMATAEALREKKLENPDIKIVCYVNTTAAVKAESYICCTSANSDKVIEAIPHKEEILFVPDQYLGNYASSRTGRKINYWSGFCPTHKRIRANDIDILKERFPDSQVLVHPECTPEVIQKADRVFSTGGMIQYIRGIDNKEIIVGTEVGIIHRMKKENPTNYYIPVSE